MVAARGGQVLLAVPPELRRLLGSLPGVAALARPEDPVRYQCHASLMSLPSLFATTLDTIPPPAPLRGDPAAFRDVLDAMRGVKVGLCWGGQAGGTLAGRRMDRRRSMRLIDMEPLLEVPGCSFVSLQKGPPASQLTGVVPGKIIDIADRLRDWQDTADLVAGLDLVVSVDSAICHLAGSIGKPVWMLNRFDTCWRWFLDRSDSPWYPSMRIFRQSAPGDWAAPVAEAARDLRHLAEAVSVT